MTSFEGESLEYALQFEFLASNEEAEYDALITELRLSKELKVDWLKAYSTS